MPFSLSLDFQGAIQQSEPVKKNKSESEINDFSKNPKALIETQVSLSDCEPCLVKLA